MCLLVHLATDVFLLRCVNESPSNFIGGGGGGKLVAQEKEVSHFITIAHIFTFRGVFIPKHI